MDYREYLASTTAAGDSVLADWRWLIGPSLQLFYVTKAGDAFLRDPSDGSVHFLDVVSGQVERIAQDQPAFETAIAKPMNFVRWLMPDVVDGQAELGMRPTQDRCLSFKKPPVLGGQLDPDNFETCDICVHFSTAGQIHHQVKNLPDGTKIGTLKIEAPQPPTQRPWWKFW